MQLRWGAIFGGAFVALALWVLLYTLGLAVGLTTIDPSESPSMRTLGIGTGIWGILAPLIALFIGSLVAARSAGDVGKAGGLIHGLVVWAFTTILGVWLIGNALGALVSGVAQIGGTAVSAVGGASGQAPQLARSLGLDANDLLGPINQRLQAQGKPTVTAEQMQAVLKDSAGTAVRQGRLDRNLLISSVERNTRLDRADAEQVANDIQQRFGQAESQLGQQASGVAQTAANVGARVFWGLFGVLLLGLISSLLGGLTGARTLARAVEHEVPAVDVPASGTGRREVYP